MYRSYCNSKVRDIAKSRAQLTPMRTTVAYSRTKNCFMLDYSHSPHYYHELRGSNGENGSCARLLAMSRTFELQ
jgi:hypothetical protein